ncbi:hypothetical protein QE152_g15420 [Popillia japonica]|uniref:Uncharacterized protein n=1 Tax=Popillia japonica TaxID=7064 RepID=A0AAW1L922_POPJA
MGLPPPPKQKGITPTIHLEIILPLMEEITEEAEVEDEIEETETEMKPEKDNLTPKTGKVKKGKGGKNSPYAALDEYALELRNKIKDKSFKTEKLSWAKFPDDAIIVEPPHNDLKAVRDTFRSIIKTGLEGHKKEARKGGKKGKKGKKAKDKDPKKKNRKDKKKKEKQVTTTSATSTEKVEVEKPQEVILKKVTLARFDCELHDINWSDRTIDFYWADHPDANPKAIPVEGSLRAVQYAGDPSTKQSDGDVSRKKTTLPQLFTCQVGFGLSRL